MDQVDDDYGNAMFSEQMEQDTLDVLDRCYQRGASFRELYFLAAQLGVGEQFRRTHEVAR